MYFVYFLQSLKDKKFYIGCSTDLQKRLEYHNRGANKSTKNRRPLILVYSEQFKDKHSAFKREFFLKSTRGFLEKRRIIENLKHSGVAQAEGSPSGVVAQLTVNTFFIFWYNYII